MHKSDLLTFGTIGILGTAFLSFCFGGPVRDFADQRTNASVSDYNDLAMLAKSCPSLATETKAILADGRMDVLEARSIAAVMKDRVTAYQEAKARSDALAAAGSKPTPVPGRCSNWSDGSNGELPSPLFYSYVRA